MIKRTIKETVTEYDKDGNIVKKTITETTEDDNTTYWPYNPSPIFTTTSAVTPMCADATEAHYDTKQK